MWRLSWNKGWSDFLVGTGENMYSRPFLGVRSLSGVNIIRGFSAYENSSISFFNRNASLIETVSGSGSRHNLNATQIKHYSKWFEDSENPTADNLKTRNRNIPEIIRSSLDPVEKYFTPEIILGEENAHYFNRASKAWKSARAYFDNVPNVSTIRFLQLMKLGVDFYAKRHSDGNLVRDELLGEGTDIVLAQTLHTLEEYARLSDLAYESSSTIYNTLKRKGFVLVTHSSSVETERPSYYLAYNPTKKVALVSVKGTKSLDDMITNCLHTPEPFIAGSFAHSGFSSAARYVVSKVVPVLEDLFVPLGYKIVFTGHSLGAGTATLASMLLNWEYKIACHCYAIAPPPSLEKETADKVAEFVTAVVNNSDIIPRWNFGLVSAAVDIVADWDQYVEKYGYFHMLHRLQDDAFIQKESVRQRDLYQKKASRQGIQNDMHIGGKVVFIRRCDNVRFARYVSNTFSALRGIEPSASFLTDHACEEYVASISSAKPI